MSPPPIDPDALDDAVHWAHTSYGACDVCAERCGVDRLAGERGVCGLGPEGRVYKEYVHLGEERCLVPSHTVFLTGCNFRCVFCSDSAQVGAPADHGQPMSPETLADRIALRRSHGARNVNFVGGLPDVNVLFILRTLQLCQRDTHVVWNTNIWTTETAIARLSGVVGTWLVDLKFANDECARALGAPAGYWTKMQRLFPIVANTGRVLVRHLVMPGHIQCCTRGVLEWLAKHHQAVTVNLMTGYQPFQLAGGSGPMARRLSDDERQQALALFDSLSFASAMVDGAEWP